VTVLLKLQCQCKDGSFQDSSGVYYK